MVRRVSQTSVVIVIIIVATVGTGVALRFCDNLHRPWVAVFRHNMPHAFLLSWDDGIDDLNFSFIEDQYGVKHTSFVVTERIGDKVLWGLDMLFRGHDIQSHSHLHLRYSRLNSTYTDTLFHQSSLDIAQTFGYTPILLSYPYGAANADTEVIALRYFDVARGVIPENASQLGSWPIPNDERGKCKHSFPCVDGLCGQYVNLLVPTFRRMTQLSGHRAFKCYGHTQMFSAEEVELFEKALASLTARNDTWFTSWGEAIAYQMVRQHTHICEYVHNDDVISFRPTLRELDSKRYPVSVTVLVPLPDHWANPLVTVDDIVVPSTVTEVDGVRTVMFDVTPSGQRVEVRRTPRATDSFPPEIRFSRCIRDNSGVALLFDITDADSRVLDVNITVFDDVGRIYRHFDNVQNPVFWHNSTYGRVVFNPIPGVYTIVVKASDCSANVATLELRLSL
ncbi:MAG: polysaccharide deacetylase family protein [Candidatus Thorarchaeota archaeon]